MNCADVGAMLPDLAVGTLDEREVERVEAHLALCAACSAELRLVSLLGRERPTVPEGLAARIRTALAADAGARREAARPVADAKSRRRFGFGFPEPRWGWASAAVLVLALGTTLVLSRTTAPGEEDVFLASLDASTSVWPAGDGMVAGAPLLDDLSDLSDEDLAALLQELEG